MIINLGVKLHECIDDLLLGKKKTSKVDSILTLDDVFDVKTFASEMLRRHAEWGGDGKELEQQLLIQYVSWKNNPVNDSQKNVLLVRKIYQRHEGRYSYETILKLLTEVAVKGKNELSPGELSCLYQMRESKPKTKWI